MEESVKDLLMTKNQTIREQLEAYIEKKYKLHEEQLPFNHEDYAVFRQPSGKWFAVFFVKPYSEFGLGGDKTVDVVSFKIRDHELTETLYDQPGYIKGYPNSGWGWVSALLDGTVPFEDLCRWLDESYESTLHEPGNMNISLEKRK